jgi:RNA polymerase sigma factor (sigma-70 family)
MQDDRTLLLGLIRGEAASAAVLWDRHAGRVGAYARTLVRCEADADDVTQGVFCGLLGLSASRAREIQDVGAYLMRSARNLACNTLRGARRRAEREGAGRGNAADVGTGVRDGDLRRALGALPRRQREVLVLHSVLGLTFDQASAATGVARGTLASRHAAGLAALERLLTPMDRPAAALAGSASDE